MYTYQQKHVCVVDLFREYFLHGILPLTRAQQSILLSDMLSCIFMYAVCQFQCDETQQTDQQTELLLLTI